jgi:hypothetical protein
VHRLSFVVVALALLCVAAASAASSGDSDQLGPAPSGLPQTWIASMHLNGHVFREGDTITATVKVQADRCFVPNPPCVSSVSWNVGAGFGKLLSGCQPKVPLGTPTLVCRFRAVETDGWVIAQTSFGNPTGSSAVSEDFFTVVGPSTRVISGTVTHPYSGRGIAGVPIAIEGPKRKVALRTDASGFFSAVMNKRGSYTVSYGDERKFIAHSAREVHVELGAKAVANFQLRRKHRFHFGLRDERKQNFVGSALVFAGPGKQLLYRGDDWDGEGSQVVVSSGGKEISKPSAADAFAGVALPLEAYPDDDCRVSVTAQQDRTKRTVTAFAPQTIRVAFAAGGPDDVRVHNGRRTRTGSFICAGEQVEVNGSGTAVYQSIRKETGWQGLAVASAAKSIRVDGGIFAPRIKIALADGTTATVKGPGGGDVSEYDFAARGTQDLQLLPEELSAAVLSGFAQREGNLHAGSGLKLDGADIFVRGNVTIDGGLSGKGAIIATGSITIHGPVSLYSDGANALRSSGPLTLTG